MKISLSKLFDLASIQDDDMREQLTPLVNHLNSALDNIITALRNEITLADNVKGNLKILQMKHDNETTFRLGGGFIGLTPLLVESKDVGLDSYKVRIVSGNQVGVTPLFTDQDPTKQRSVRWYIFNS